MLNVVVLTLYLRLLRWILLIQVFFGMLSRFGNMIHIGRLEWQVLMRMEYFHFTLRRMLMVQKYVLLQLLMARFFLLAYQKMLLLEMIYEFS